MLNIYALKEPQQYTFILDNEILKIGVKEHILADFKSYWIFERETGSVLILTGKRMLNSHLEVPLANIAPQSVRNILSGIIEEKEIEESLVDILARRLKF